MLKFLVFNEGQPARQYPLRNAHLIGADRSAMRGEVTFEGGAVVCQKRDPGAAALVLQNPPGDCGELSVSTCLLPERPEPYLLSLEQARHRVMLLISKLEDWGMFDLPDDHPVARRVEKARKLFIEALCQQEAPPEADRLSKECLVAAIDASEELALSHADLLLNRRRAVAMIPKNPIGCGVAPDQTSDRVRASLLANFDFVHLPMPWRQLAPAEGDYRWAQMDNWAEWAAKTKMPVVAGPVISFEPSVLPDWVYIWEHDYETVRDLLYEHTERVVSRYRHVVSSWNVVSGLHINSHFTFSFEQLMEVTRMCTMLVKKVQPNARALVEVRQPFGEYFATNPRSIPPLMYADQLIQSAVNFDGFALRLLMGQAAPGQYTRDLMQISHLLDQFAVFGKPLHLTVAAPSEMVTEMMIAAPDPTVPVDANAGYWRKAWSPLVQSRWLEAVFYVAMSKPLVESVTWQDLVDHPNIELPMAGLVTDDLQPKASFRRLVAFRRSLALKGPLGAPAASGALTAPGADTAGPDVFSPLNVGVTAAVAGPAAVTPQTSPAGANGSNRSTPAPVAANGRAALTNGNSGGGGSSGGAQNTPASPLPSGK